MGKKSIFTSEQKLIFDKISSSDFFNPGFYFTGGTALSEFYLKHRYSEDLDFFSEKKFSNDQIEMNISKWGKELGFTYSYQFREVVYIYILKFKNRVNLKVDFGYYPYKRIEKGRIEKRMTVDSLFDIAVNKLSAVNERSTVKDFVDLYYLLKKFTLWDLINGVKVKFGRELDHWIITADMSFAVKDFNSLPRLIRPLTLIKLKNFYNNLAVKLGRKAVE